MNIKCPSYKAFHVSRERKKKTNLHICVKYYLFYNI